MPKQLQRAMAAEQEATREAKAKIAAADGELKSATVLREASETMAANPIALQLRYLQTLNTVSADKNHTIVVPFPLDIIRKILGTNGKQNNDFNPRNDLENQKPKENIEPFDISKFIDQPRKDALNESRDSFY